MKNNKTNSHQSDNTVGSAFTATLELNGSLQSFTVEYPEALPKAEMLQELDATDYLGISVLGTLAFDKANGSGKHGLSKAQQKRAFDQVNKLAKLQWSENLSAEAGDLYDLCVCGQFLAQEIESTTSAEDAVMDLIQHMLDVAIDITSNEVGEGLLYWREAESFLQKEVNKIHSAIMRSSLQRPLKKAAENYLHSLRVGGERRRLNNTCKSVVKADGHYFRK